MPEVTETMRRGTHIFETTSEADSRTFAMALGAFLRPSDAVLLQGDLGTGKSVMARGIARALGVRGNMPSPSFPIMIPYQGKVPVYHFDLYRLSDPDEFYAAGLDEFLDGDGVSIVEWPEMGDIRPERAVRLRLNRTDRDDARRIEAAFERIGAEEDLLSALERWRLPDEHPGD